MRPAIHLLLSHRCMLQLCHRLTRKVIAEDCMLKNEIHRQILLQIKVAGVEVL